MYLASDAARDSQEGQQLETKLLLDYPELDPQSAPHAKYQGFVAMKPLDSGEGAPNLEP
jgi:hypothetical protein